MPSTRQLPSGTPRHVTCNEQGQLCITAVDPATRKLLIPLTYVYETRAQQRPTLPSLCQLFLRGRCRQGSGCYQVHANVEVVRALRAQIDSLPCCCLYHGDMDRAGVYTTAVGERCLHDVLLYIPHCTAFPGGLVPLQRVSYTAALGRLLREQDPLHAYQPSTLLVEANHNDSLAHFVATHPPPQPQQQQQRLELSNTNHSVSGGDQLSSEETGGVTRDVEDGSENSAPTSSAVASEPVAPLDAMIMMTMVETEAANRAAGGGTGGMVLKMVLDGSACTICRLHAMDRCRYAEECKFLHLCKEITQANPDLTSLTANHGNSAGDQATAAVVATAADHNGSAPTEGGGESAMDMSVSMDSTGHAQARLGEENQNPQPLHVHTQRGHPTKAASSPSHAANSGGRRHSGGNGGGGVGSSAGTAGNNTNSCTNGPTSSSTHGSVFTAISRQQEGIDPLLYARQSIGGAGSSHGSPGPSFGAGGGLPHYHHSTARVGSPPHVSEPYQPRSQQQQQQQQGSLSNVYGYCGPHSQPPPPPPPQQQQQEQSYSYHSSFPLLHPGCNAEASSAGGAVDPARLPADAPVLPPPPHTVAGCAARSQPQPRPPPLSFGDRHSEDAPLLVPQSVPPETWSAPAAPRPPMPPPPSSSIPSFSGAGGGGMEGDSGGPLSPMLQPPFLRAANPSGSAASGPLTMNEETTSGSLPVGSFGAMNTAAATTTTTGGGGGCGSQPSAFCGPVLAYDQGMGYAPAPLPTPSVTSHAGNASSYHGRQMHSPLAHPTTYATYAGNASSASSAGSVVTRMTSTRTAPALSGYKSLNTSINASGPTGRVSVRLPTWDMNTAGYQQNTISSSPHLGNDTGMATTTGAAPFSGSDHGRTSSISLEGEEIGGGGDGSAGPIAASTPLSAQRHHHHQQQQQSVPISSASTQPQRSVFRDMSPLSPAQVAPGGGVGGSSPPSQQRRWKHNPYARTAEVVESAYMTNSGSQPYYSSTPNSFN